MPKQKLDEVMNRLLMLIESGYPVIYIVSHEEARVLDYLTKIVRVIKKNGAGGAGAAPDAADRGSQVRKNAKKNLVRWFEGEGFSQLPNLAQAEFQGGGVPWLSLEGPTAKDAWSPLPNAQKDAGACLKSVREATLQGSPPLHDSLVVFYDFHPYLKGDIVVAPGGSQVRMLRKTADELRRYYDNNRVTPDRRYKTIIIIAPSAERLSMELERDILVVEFPLPETAELRMELDSAVNRGVLTLPQDRDEDQKSRLRDMIAAAGRGLTLEDYKRGLSMLAVRGRDTAGKDAPVVLTEDHVEDMLNLKAKAINNRALEYTPHVNIELGGLEVIKEWIRQRRDPAVSSKVRDRYHLPALKGVMLCGASGGGKSQLAKLIAKEFNLALLRLDVGALFGSFVGESEQRTREALMLAEVLSPVVLWIDEVDKAFTGTGSGGDNGVSSRVFGAFLTWLAEKDDSVFVVTTANDFTEMLTRFPEFSRKGRFDELYWVGLPDASAREQIFRIYLEPHWKSGYFTVTDDDVARLDEPYQVTGEYGLQRPDAFTRLCALLAHDAVSTKMTGAEIEQSIKEALFQAYDGRNKETGRAALSPDLVVAAVRQLAARALYQPGTKDGDKLEMLEQEARDRGWPEAGGNASAG